MMMLQKAKAGSTSLCTINVIKFCLNPTNHNFKVNYPTSHIPTGTEGSIFVSVILF